MPQPTAPPASKPAETPAKPAETPAVPQGAIAVLGNRTPEEVAKDASATAVQRQIARAHILENERAEKLEKIGQNRDYLRLMDKNEEMNKAESAWLATFYPEKEKDSRRSKDEIDATRKAREAARK